LTRPFDKHLDSDEIDSLVSSSAAGVTESGRLPDRTLGEVRRHVESCQDCDRKVQMHKAVQSEISRMRVPNPSPPSPECTGDVEWLEVAAGLLSEAKTRELMKHAAQCAHCGLLLKNAAETIADEATSGEESMLASLQSARPEWRKNMAATLRDSVRERQPRSSWLKAVVAWPGTAYLFAGIVALAVVAWIGVRVLHPPSAEQLLAQAYSEHRTLEVRISGARYSPVRVERGGAGSSLDKPPALLKAEALIGENLRKHPNDPVWLQARARADLLDGNYESAINSLQRALEAQPDDPSLLTDLGSAYYVRAESGDRPIDYGNAVQSFGKALAKSPNDTIALFNRALACERLFLYTQAVDDWQHYLRVDPQGDWSSDARARLAALLKKIEQHKKSENEPLLTPEEIATAGADDAGVREEIDRRVEDYLNIAVTDWLPDAYPTAGQKSGDQSSDARAALAILADIAVQNHGDRWLADLVESGSSVNFALAVENLSAALKANEAGDNVAAGEHAGKAAEKFDLVASDAGALRAKIEYVFAAVDAKNGLECGAAAREVYPRLRLRSYRWLRAQFLIELGGCKWLVGDLGGAGKAFDEASREAQASGYGVIYLRTQDHLSILKSTIGDLPSAWAVNHAALARFWSGRYPAMRGYNLYFGCYEFARSRRQPLLQLSAWRDGLALSDSVQDTLIRAMAHSLMANAAVSAGQATLAEKEFARARKLFVAAPQIKSTRIGAVEAQSRLAEVETSAGRPQEAVLGLRELESQVSELKDNYLSILFFTALGDALSEVGDDKQAELALRAAVEAAEVELRSVDDQGSRLRWSEQTSKAYRDFIQLRLRRGDTLGALEMWEWYRGASQRSLRRPAAALLPIDLEPHQVASRLPNLDRETIVSYAFLPHGLATWVFDSRGVHAHWTEEETDRIEVLLKRFRVRCADPKSDEGDLRRNSRDLYDLLVAPILSHLAADRTIVLELDGSLEGIAYEALIDPQNRYLGDRGSIISSPGIYYRRNPHLTDTITANSRTLVAAVPTSSAAESPLPDAVPEGEMVAGNFNAARLLTGSEANLSVVFAELPKASVFHFAGHALSTPQRSGLLLPDMLFKSGALKRGLLSNVQLAVFSACDTQDISTEGAYDADSMVRVFLQEGVPHVVASRWNVDSAATRQFMNSFYQALLKGNSVAESIHRAQVSLRSAPGMAHPYYWSAFTAFGLT
jgi:CHAT domain-containing protein/tetratricopeptide (TPR) repeat protein